MVWEAWQIWIAVGLGLMVLEVFVPGFVLACLGLGSFGGAIAAYLEASFEMQLGIRLDRIGRFYFPPPFCAENGILWQRTPIGC